MPKFICTSKEQDALDYKGEKIGVTEKRALFYSSKLGRERIYRDSFSHPQRGFKLLDFTSAEKAKKVCIGINETYGDDFKAEEVK